MAAQLDGTVGHVQVAQFPADVARRQAERGLGLLVDHGHSVISGHHDLRHRTGTEGEVADRVHPGDLTVAFEHPTRRRAFRADRTGGDPAEDPVLQVQRGEPVGVTEQHLGVTEEQHAPWCQREMQAAEHAALGVGVEVHQSIAAAQILAEYVPAADRLDVPVEQVSGHRYQRSDPDRLHNDR